MTDKYFKLKHFNKEHNDWFVVNWCLGNTCNYACSYCPNELHDGSIPWPDRDKVMSFITRTVEQAAPRKVYFEFTGGEVTLYKHFIEICQHVTSLGCRVGLISNGGRTQRWWEENLQYFDHVCLSYHPEEAKPDHFLNIARLLSDKLRVHVNIMMSPEKFDECLEVAEACKDIKNITLALQPLIHDFGSILYDYTPEQKAIIDEQHQRYGKYIVYEKRFTTYRGAMLKVFNDRRTESWTPHRLINERQNNWQGWDCWIGVEQMVIDMEGNIYRGWCKVGKSIGNILDDEINIPTRPVTCVKTMCHCNFDIMSTKRNPNETPDNRN